MLSYWAVQNAEVHVEEFCLDVECRGHLYRPRG